MYGNEAHQFCNPHGVTVSPVTGHIYVADWDNDRIKVFNSDLTVSHSFGEKGSAEGQFNRPYSIAINSQGFLYVADTQ